MAEAKKSNLASILGAAKAQKGDFEEASAAEQRTATAPDRKRAASSTPPNSGNRRKTLPETNTKIPKAVFTETPPSNEPAVLKRGTEKLVHITIEVPVSYRHHWKIESARHNRTFRDVAVEAFTKEFGLPQGDK